MSRRNFCVCIQKFLIAELISGKTICCILACVCVRK